MSGRWSISAITVTLILFSGFAEAQDSRGLSREIQKILKKYNVSNKEIGIYVYDSDAQSPVVGINENRLFVPASISKIPTATAALKILGPSHQFETTLKSNSSIQGERLKGNLYLVGGGDPGFVSERMWLLVNEFWRTPVRIIEGDLIVDDEIFDDTRFDKSRDDGRVDRAYDAPVGAMSFNWNSLNVYIRPGLAVGKPARVIVDPENSYIQVINKVKTSDSVVGCSLSAHRRQDPKSKVIQVIASGCIGQSGDEKVFYRGIIAPPVWAGENLKAFLARRGVFVKGAVKRGKAPDSAQTLASLPSLPVRQSVVDMMKFSNNFVAEMLTKNISLSKGDRIGNLKSGVKYIQSYLTSIGVPKEHFVFENPSGLTTENKMTPWMVVKVLNTALKDMNLSGEFLSSLPIAGVDGTLKNRFTQTVARGRVRAKTGLLKNSGAASIAGYASQLSGKTYSFAIIYNKKGGLNPNSVWKLLDEIVVSLVD